MEMIAASLQPQLRANVEKLSVELSVNIEN